MRALFVVASLSALSGLLSCSSFFNCPTATPANGSACHDRAFVCETGGVDHERCSTISSCSDAPDSTWSNQSDSMCTTTNASTCADSYLDTTVGSPCPTSGQSCDYPEGRCSCVPCAPSGVAWQCRVWTAGLDPSCPSDRPAIGSKCTVPSLICTYDNTCTVSFGPNIECINERWQPTTGAPATCATPICLP